MWRFTRDPGELEEEGAPALAVAEGDRCALAHIVSALEDGRLDQVSTPWPNLFFP